ncbi:MAG: hypothetical protein ACOC7P_02315 [Chloroflexota bacterium]
MFYVRFCAALLQGRGIISTCSMTPACRDKSGRQLINGVGVNTYFGSVNFLYIRRCEYVGWRAFSVNFALDIMLPVIGNDPRKDLARDDEISCPCCGAAMGIYYCPTCGFSRSLL